MNRVLMGLLTCALTITALQFTSAPLLAQEGEDHCVRCVGNDCEPIQDIHANKCTIIQGPFGPECAPAGGVCGEVEALAMSGQVVLPVGLEVDEAAGELPSGLFFDATADAVRRQCDFAIVASTASTSVSTDLTRIRLQ